MNTRIIRLFIFITGCFVLLVGFTSYWSVFDATNLKNQRVNKRPLFEAQQIKRGRITTVDGELIAKSVGAGSGASRQYVREYPNGSLFSHPIGYSFAEQGNSEFEAFHNDELIGEGSEFTSILDELRGRKQTGNNIRTNIDSVAQKTAFDLLAGRPGAVVAMVPSTGEVRAMVSEPPYDPNTIPDADGPLNPDSGLTTFDRASQGQYPPGSTFKLVTATAALDSGTVSADELINSPPSLSIQGQPLRNDFEQDFGDIDMTTALTNSVNTYFAQLGEKVGKETLYNYMERFGFDAKPQIDLPLDQLSISGVFDGDTLRGAN